MSRNNAELATDLLHSSLQVLSQHGGKLPSSEVVKKAGILAKTSGDECRIYEATGNTRWKSILHLQSIGLVKGGYIQKRKGVWYLTEEGEDALSLSPKQLWKQMKQRYKDWKSNQSTDPDRTISDNSDDDEGIDTTTLLTEKIEELANAGIEKALRKLGPYQFQDLVGALLRGMGYHTPFISPKGKDGGVDVIAYKDPLGTEAPAILCQVKHRPDASAGIADVQRLMGSLHSGKSVGLFVTSGTYSNDAITAARNSHAHIELIDRTRFIELWIEHYEHMEEEDRALLRLKLVHVMEE